MIQPFAPPFTSTSSTSLDNSLRKALISADIDALNEASMSLEGLALDDEKVRRSLGQSNEDGGLLKQMLHFIEHGCPPPWLSSEPEQELKKYEKTIGLCKAALIKTVITVAGEDQNMEPMWKGTQGDSQPEAWFVQLMLEWLRKPQGDQVGISRDDLLICATLSLGNLARKGEEIIDLTSRFSGAYYQHLKNLIVLLLCAHQSLSSPASYPSSPPLPTSNSSTASSHF